MKTLEASYILNTHIQAAKKDVTKDTTIISPPIVSIISLSSIFRLWAMITNRSVVIIEAAAILNINK
jgi:hypothetical protein